LLATTGAVSSQPNVDAGTSICDFDEEEKHHKHSIESKLVHCDHAGLHFNIFDTPGYPELIGQTVGVLHAVETAVIAVDGHAGLKVNTRRVFREASERGLARIICITKIDDSQVNLAGLVETVRDVFGHECVLLNAPDATGDGLSQVVSTLAPGGTSTAIDMEAVHQQAVESIIETDEAMLEKYFEGEVPPADQLLELAAQAVAAGTLVPIVCVSAKRQIGLRELLDVLAALAVPANHRKVVGQRAGDSATVAADPNGPLVAQIFKTRIDPYVQKLSFARIYSGTLTKETSVETSGERKAHKLGAPLRVQADKTETIESAGPGDIVAFAKCDFLHTGTTLGDIALPPPSFPQPMVGLAVTAKNRGDETKLSTALHKLAEEDPTVHVDHDAETHETVLTGMSELHLGLIRERLARRDHVEIETHEPKIPYRETITQNADGSYRHKKQSGGSGQFAEVHIRMFPLPEGTKVEDFATKDRFPQLKHVHYHDKHNFLWIDSVVGGSIPGNFMPAIEKGFLERIDKGVIAGCKVQDVCVEVHFGKDHPVDSNETAFKIAAAKVFSEVFKQAKPALLEPMVTLHITVPADNVGDVSGDLAGRRGQMLGMDSAGGGMTTVEAKAPLSEVMHYARTLSSMTGGQGAYTMDFSHYEPVPGNVQAEVLANAKVKEIEE
jgi:elongation factor G